MRRLWLAAVLLLVSCRSSEATPEGVAQAFFSALQDHGPAEATQYVDETYGDLEVLNLAAHSDESRDLMQALWAKSSFDVGKRTENVQGDAVVPVRISTPDVLALIAEASNGTFNSPPLQSVRVALERENLPMRQATVEIEVQKTDRGWLLWPSRELDYALMGSMVPLGR